MYKVLSLDGGGSRGVLSICMLKNVEQSIATKYGREVQPIQSYFDYITGTSIGGLAAAALSVPDDYGNFKYNATYLCDHLAYRGVEIFSDDKWFSVGGVLRSKYHREPLTNILEELLGDKRLTDTKLPISMHALKLGTNEPVTWSSYLAHIDKAHDHKLVDIAAATSAAPTYFDPKIIDGQMYVDGGLFANDPISAGLATFIKYNPNFNRHNTSVLSVGTGKKAMDSSESAPRALKGTELFDIIDIIFEANKNSQSLLSFNVLENYYKMDPVIRDGIFKLDVKDLKVIKEYQDIAQEYTSSCGRRQDTTSLGVEE